MVGRQLQADGLNRRSVCLSLTLVRHSRIDVWQPYLDAGTLLTYRPSGQGTYRMDMTWVTERIALGGGIWTSRQMAEVARAGITHIIDMQIEFDDTNLAEPHGIEVLWNPIDDDFQPKPPEIFQRGVDFAIEALGGDETRLFIHCAAGVHRAPMMTLAVLCSMGWSQEAALELIERERPVVDFADVYVRSVEKFLDQQVRAGE